MLAEKLSRREQCHAGSAAQHQRQTPQIPTASVTTTPTKRGQLREYNFLASLQLAAVS